MAADAGKDDQALLIIARELVSIHRDPDSWSSGLGGAVECDGPPRDLITAYVLEGLACAAPPIARPPFWRHGADGRLLLL